MTTASGAETIAHGLAVVPRFVRVHVTHTNSADTREAVSHGSFDGTTNRCVFVLGIEGDAQSGNSSTFSIKVGLSTTAHQTAILTFDLTNITLTWTRTGAPDGTAPIHLEVIS